MSTRKVHKPSGIPLEPCPFCDTLGVDVWTSATGLTGGWYAVQCGNHICEARGPLRGTELGAVSAWSLLRVGAVGMGPSEHTPADAGEGGRP